MQWVSPSVRYGEHVQHKCNSLLPSEHSCHRAMVPPPRSWSGETCVCVSKRLTTLHKLASNKWYICLKICKLTSAHWNVGTYLGRLPHYKGAGMSWSQSNMCNSRLCTRRSEGQRQQWWQCKALPPNSTLSAPFIVVQRSPWKMSLNWNSTEKSFHPWFEGNKPSPQSIFYSQAVYS